MLVPFIFLTAVLVLLIVLSNVLTDQSLKSRQADEHLMDIAAEQQMRSLRIIKEATADQLDGKLIDLPLDSLINALSADQHTELSAIEKKNIPYLQELKQIDQVYHDYDASLKLLLTEKDIRYLVSLLSKQNSYLQSLDKFILAVSKHSNQKVSRFRLLQDLIMIAIVAILALEAFFLFVPAVNRIKRQNERLRQIAFYQSHLVRHPLANIQGLLQLMESVGPEEREELWGMIKSETEKLDEVIHNTVKETDDTYSPPQLSSRSGWWNQAVKYYSKSV